MFFKQCLLVWPGIKFIIYLVTGCLKGTSGRKKGQAQMKEREKFEKRAITDLNAPNGSRDIPFQSQDFEQDGHRHFVDF